MFTRSTRASRQLAIVGLATLGLAAGVVAIYTVVRVNGTWPGVPLAMPNWLILAFTIFAAATVSSIVGFAFSAIAGALILHQVGDAVAAVQIMMIASIGIQSYSVTRLAGSIQWSRCVPFIAGGVLAMPLGFALLLNLDPTTYLLAIGAALVVYGSYQLFKRPAAARSGRRPLADTLVGALGGITGPLAAFPGACVTIWCAMRGWTKLEQRGVYQPYILVMQLVGLGTLSVLKPANGFDPLLLGYVLPGVAGAVVGLRIFHLLSDSQFQKVVNVALVLSGMALLVK